MPKVGVISPSARGIKAEELARLLPPEIELALAACNIARGTLEELQQSFSCFEEKVAAMAALNVALIHPAGVPFLLLGPQRERELVTKWEKQHKIPVFTNAMSQVNALKAFGAKRIISSSYFSAPINEMFTKYLVQAGFDVLESIAFDIGFSNVPLVDAGTLRKFFDALYERNPGAEALHLIGPGWRATLNMIDEMEDAYRIPVIHHVPAQSWEIQRRLGFRRPVEGYGRLIREFP